MNNDNTTYDEIEEDFYLTQVIGVPITPGQRH